jgi:hypothetical protein
MKLSSLIEGISLGAVGMFLLDPDQGGRRRALVKDQVVHHANRKREAVRVMGIDFVNRTKGLRYRVKSHLDKNAISDEVLIERCKAEIGHCVSHAGAIQISCLKGAITLSGPILVAEMDACLRQIQAIAGVRQVVNNLEVHSSPEHIPALQGNSNLPIQGRWTPATSLVMGIAGAMCALYGMKRKGVVGSLMQVGGMGMVAKAFRDTEHRFDPSPKRISEGDGKSQPLRGLATRAMEDTEQVTDRGQAGMI